MDDFLKGIEIKIMQLAKNKEYDTEVHKAPSTFQKVMHIDILCTIFFFC